MSKQPKENILDLPRVEMQYKLEPVLMSADDFPEFLRFSPLKYKQDRYNSQEQTTEIDHKTE